MIDFLVKEIAPWVAILLLLLVEWSTHRRVNHMNKIVQEMGRAKVDALPVAAERQTGGKVECALCTSPATGFYKSGQTPLCEEHLKMVGHRI